jgi:hypothetical protein
LTRGQSSQITKRYDHRKATVKVHLHIRFSANQVGAHRTEMKMKMKMKNLFVALALLTLPVISAPLLPQQVNAAAVGHLGDLTPLTVIAQDTLALVENSDLVAAKARITDFEKVWDTDQPKLYAMNKQEWGVIDDAADAAISSLRASKPSAPKAQKAVTRLITALKNPTVQ